MRRAFVRLVVVALGGCTPFAATTDASDGGASSSSSGGSSSGGTTLTCTGAELYCQTFDAVATIDDLTSGPAATSGQTDDMSLTASTGQRERALRIVPTKTASYYESRVVFEQSTAPSQPFTLRFDLALGAGAGYEVGGIELEPTSGDTIFVKLTVDVGRRLTAQVYGNSETSLGTLPSGLQTITLTVDPAGGKMSASVAGAVKALPGITAPANLKTFRVVYGLVGNASSTPGEFAYDNVSLTVGR